LNIAYGHTVVHESDAYVALADAALQTSAHAGLFGTYLVDYVPILKHVPSWMPGASFKRKAREWQRLSRAMLESQFKTVKQKLVSRTTTYIRSRRKVLQAEGTAASCIATRELENWMNTDGNADEEELIKNVTAIIYAGRSAFLTDIEDLANLRIR